MKPQTRVRAEIPDAFKWDLTKIYPHWDAWQADYQRLESLVEAFAARRGTLGQGSEALLGSYEAIDELGQLAYRVWYYPALRHDEDQRDNDVNARRQQVQILMARWQQATSWFNPELLLLPLDRVRAWMDASADLARYRFAIENLYRQQEHVLDEKGEHLMSLVGRFDATASEAYSALSTADAKFPDVTLSDGRVVTVSYDEYRRLLEQSRVQEDRAAVFRAYLGTFEAARNTYAALYNGVCQRDWFAAQARGFGSTLEAALHGNNIPVSVVETLVDVTRANTAGLRRYHRLRRRALGLDRYCSYDSQVPIVDIDRAYHYDEARAWVIDSVAPLGPAYQAEVRRSFAAGGIDVYGNDGKRSGAYSAPVYGVHPYMLLNHNDTLDAVFTLAHEMGHNIHTVLAHAHQPFAYSDYTIFVAEVPSTLSEALLLEHLLARSSDPRERARLLEHAIDGIAGTFFAQVLFADFELRAHRIAERDQPITADILSEVYGQLLADYYGDAFDEEPLARLTWARVPHFYGSPFYVYQYATCFASAAQLVAQIRGGSEDSRTEAAARYLGLLQAGGSDYPMDLLRRAGVDLREPEPVRAVITQFDTLVARLEAELAALDTRNLTMRRPTRTALAALACLGLLRPAATAGQTAGEAAPGVLHAALPVPGGVPALARAIGLNDTTPRARVMLAAIRVLHERPAGADPAADGRRVTALAYVVQSGGQGAGPADTVPLPLPADVWTALPDVKAEWRASVLAIILGDRRAALAYYGLCAMDIETRAYLAGHADARAVIFGAKAAPVVALYGRSLRIRDGRVEVPGGAAAQPVWESLSGAPVADPAAFLTQLLTRDGGRLALFFDTLAQLDGPRLAFAFGGPGGDAPARAARLKALYDASAPALAGWDPLARPFIRVAYDAAQLLQSVHVTADGDLAGPAVRGLWTAAFDGKGLPGLAGEEIKGIRADDRIDAAGLVGLLGGANTTMRRERTECWLFAQRAFAVAAPADWLNVLVTLRGYQTFPALVTTLERIGITRPATYAAAIRRANRITRGFDRRTSTTAVALFQGGLALIERARFSRAIDAAKADALVGSLSAVVGSFEGEYLGGIAEWIDMEFLAAVGGLRPSDAARAAVPLEDRVLAAIAGATAIRLAFTGPGPGVEWEGLRYRVDPEAADFARLVAIRGRQGSTPLDAALAFARLATSVRSAESAADVDACRRAFDEAAASVANVPGTPGPTAADLDGGQLLDRARAD